MELKLFNSGVCTRNPHAHDHNTPHAHNHNTPRLHTHAQNRVRIDSSNVHSREAILRQSIKHRKAIRRRRGRHHESADRIRQQHHARNAQSEGQESGKGRHRGAGVGRADSQQIRKEQQGVRQEEPHADRKPEQSVTEEADRPSTDDETTTAATTTVIEAMKVLADSNHELKEKSRAGKRVQGKFKDGSRLDLVKYLKSAAEAFSYDYEEAATFVVDNNPTAHSAAKLPVQTLEQYRDFCKHLITADYPRIDHELSEAATQGESQGDDESVHRYVTRCSDDHKIMQFGMEAAEWSTREITKSTATAVACAIRGLHEHLVGELETLRRERVIVNGTLSWDDLRVKAGAREDTSKSHPSNKRRKTAPAAVATPALSIQHFADTIAAATEKAVQAAMRSVRTWSTPAPAAVTLPTTKEPDLIQSALVDAIYQGSANATQLSLATALAIQPSQPQVNHTAQNSGPMAMPPPMPPMPPAPTQRGLGAHPERKRKSWPGMCNHCQVMHQSYDECPRCTCFRCNAQGHRASKCPNSACTICGNLIKHGHKPSCSGQKNGSGRR